MKWNVLLALASFATIANAAVWPGQQWPRATADNSGLDERKLNAAREYALTGGGSGYIVRGGAVVLSWGDARKLYDLKSTTKSFGAATLGIAILDDRMQLEDKARQHHPTLGTPPGSNAVTGWLDEITILHLASQTAGFEKTGGYTPLLFKPGTQWDYSDSGPNWLAECITLAYRRDLNELMFERVFTPIGITPAGLRWRRNQYRAPEIEGIARREFGAGIHANVDAMARFGLLHLRGGEWNGKQILPRAFIQAATGPVPGNTNLPVRNSAEYGHASRHYGLLWWNNDDGSLEGVPRDAYWSWGLYDSIILVIPSLDLVVARAGQSWQREKGASHYDVLKPFFLPIVEAVLNNRPGMKSGSASIAPAPPSPVIERIVWAPKEHIIRRAKGSDNWPMAWADDDSLYTAYGDGNGFEPHVPQKLSLGMARVDGSPQDFNGINLRSDIEQKGDGKHGLKASGMLAVDGVLYLWLRNATNSQLAWSRDRGATWARADWKFTNSFGCPTFLNFGRDYAGARDEFVYIFSPDATDAYTPADRMVLARVPKRRMAERSAYEFFRSLDVANTPRWTTNLAHRGAVFTNAGKCYRSGLAYNAGLKRYLWCQILGRDGRFSGGLVVLDAPEPWGPWTTAFLAEPWDVGPGETASFPPKWMSSDGTELHLVFSGDDYFSVRKATLLLRPQR